MATTSAPDLLDQSAPLPNPAEGVPAQTKPGEGSKSAPKAAPAPPSDSTKGITQPKSGIVPKAASKLPSTWSFLTAGEAPKTDLDFELSIERYDAARKCVANSSGSFWSHTMYEKKLQDETVQHVKVHYCTSKTTMENVCQRYFENEPVLGFDMEWQSYANRNSGPRQNVSLIQIASPSRIALFHTARFSKNEFVSPTFQKLMEDSNVSKVGVNILADSTRLQKFLGVKMAGVFEVSHLYNLVLFSRTRRPGRVPKTAVSMSTQIKECLGLPVFKEDSVRAGDWMSPLNARQLQCEWFRYGQPFRAIR